MISVRRRAPGVGMIRRAARALARRRVRTPKPLPPMSMNRWELVIVTTLALASVLAVAVIAASISYSHMQDWALANGEPAWRARFFPLSVDGAILAASLVLYADSRSGRPADKLAYLVVLIGIGWSVGANIGHEWVGSTAAKFIAGWPPLAMAASAELLLRFVRRWRGQADRQADQTARREQRKARITASASPTVPSPRMAKAENPRDAENTTVNSAAERSLRAVPDTRPDWLPQEPTTKTAVEAYLEAHPQESDAAVVLREVGKWVKADRSYVRRVVRDIRERVG